MNDVLRKVGQKKVNNANSRINADDMKNLILRVTGRYEYAEKFVFKNIPYKDDCRDCYRMYDEDGKIVIEATNGVTAAVCFNYYLRNYCNSYVGPINRNINLPDVPPDIGKPVENSSVFLFRYFMNYCTFGFSYIYADWNDYEKLTDWMLLSGVNLFLNIVGHEIVWRDLLKIFGYSKEEASDFICGPGYLPWQWMGNVIHYGGILPDWWYEKQKELSNKINNKMRAFGSEPILPGFFGMTPCDFKEKHPLSNSIDQGLFWFGYKRPSLLRHDDVIFKNMADAFYYTTKDHFGEVHYFSGDPFHEGGNTDGIDLGEYAGAIIDEMKKYNKDSIWFLQGWCNNPKADMLNALEREDVIVIDLVSDCTYKVSECYGGYPFIFSSVANYGAKRLMDGNIKGVIEDTFDAAARDDISCVGVGMNMEAVADNEILFEALAYNSVRYEKPDFDNFLTDYTQARFGGKYPNIIKALRLISEEVLALGNRTYNEERAATCYRGRESGLCTAPSLTIDRVTYPSTATELLYDNSVLKEALGIMLENYDELKDNKCYIFDITDIARQINANESWELLDKFRDAFRVHDYDAFEKYSNEFLALYDIQDTIMQKLPETSFAALIDKARSVGRTKKEENMFIFNWLKLIFNFQIPSQPVTDLDYGHLECSGLIIPFYKKRWEIYIEMMRYYFDTPEDLPSVAWADYAENFIFEQMIRKDVTACRQGNYEDCIKRLAEER